MRILVFGTRHWWFYGRILWFMLSLRAKYGTDITIVHGGARGADSLAARAACAVGFATEEHKPDWRIGRGAGHVRNEEMAKTRPVLAVGFGHGAGTNHMAKMCTKYNIPLVRYHVTWPA